MLFTRSLAEYVANSTYESLSEEVIHQFKRAYLDHLTAALTGSQTPVAERLMLYLAEVDKSMDASVIGRNHKLSALNAALANGTSAHALDFDDGHTQGSIHPGGVIFPAVLAAAEHRAVDVRTIILAVVVGYEITIRISSAMHPYAVNRGFHNTPVAGVFGAAAGVSILLQSGSREVLNSLGLAGSFAGGLFEFLGEGAEIKRIHAGKAARDGLLCAELGKRGITGPSSILEGRNGLFKAFTDSVVNWERLLEGLGQRFEISDVYFKPYPCCRHLHAVIDGIKKLKVDHQIHAAQVASIDVGLYEVGSRHSHRNSDNLLDAQMSIPCAASLALVFSDVTAQQFGQDYVQRSDVQDMIQRVNVSIDNECEKAYPTSRSAVVTVTLHDGRRYGTKVVDPKGEVSNPLSDSELEEKFVNNCQSIVGTDKCKRIIDVLWKFENLTTLSEFFNWADPSC